MIPQVMNFFWSGPRMTFMRYMTLRSFRHWNPNFPMVLWTADSCHGKSWNSTEMDDSECNNNDYSHLVDALQIERKTWTPPFNPISHTHASDLFRWWLLSTIGGLYADMDILWLNPIDTIHKNYLNSDSLCCMECNSSMFAIGFFGSSPNCPMFQDIYAKAIKNYSSHTYESAGAIAVYQSANNAKSARAVLGYFRIKYPTIRIVQLPDNAFYYFNCRTYPTIYTNTVKMPSQCLGLHWFGGGPASQQWNQLLTQENYTEYHNTFTHHCCKVLR